MANSKNRNTYIDIVNPKMTPPYKNKGVIIVNDRNSVVLVRVVYSLAVFYQEFFFINLEFLEEYIKKK